MAGADEDHRVMQKFANNASSALASAIAPSDTSATLATGGGEAFPNLGSGDFFLATFYDVTRLIYEIVEVTARSGDVLTIVRAQEGTTAQLWPAGAYFAATVTAGTMASLAQGGSVATNIATAQVIVGTSPTLLAEMRAGRTSVSFQDLSGTDVYIGDATVTIETGAVLQGSADNIPPMVIATSAAVYGVSSAGGQVVSVLETY